MASVVTALRAAAPWHEVLVIDDGSTDGTGRPRRQAPGARVVRHPYNKGNGAAVKTAIRAATQRLDRRSSTATASIAPTMRCGWSSRLGDFDLVIGAARSAHAGHGGAARRQRRAQPAWPATSPSGRSPTSPRASARRAANTCSSSSTCCRTASRRRRPRRWRSSRQATMSPSNRSARCRVSATRRSGSRSDGAKFLSDLAESHHHLQPAAHLRAGQRASPSRSAPVYGAWNFVYHARIPNGAVLLLMFSVMVILVGLVSEQIATLRFEGRGRSA